jgi:hypothetical protein
MKEKISAICGMIFLFCSGLIAQNAPIITAGTVVSTGSSFTVPVTVTNFNDIRSCNLELSYNSTQATALSVTTGPLLGGTLATNLSYPGKIALGWYTWPGTSLPDNTVIFNITFARVSAGPVSITWNGEGSACQWWNSEGEVLNDLPLTSFYNNGSVSTASEAPMTKAPEITACLGSAIACPVTVFSFNNIGSVSLTLQYDPAVVRFESSVTHPDFAGLTVINPTPGTIKVEGTAPASGNGITLSAGSALFTLNFNYSGGSTTLTWTDNGTSCEYQGPSPNATILYDSPQASYFVNGSISERPVPDAAGNIISPFGGNVTQGQTGVIYRVNPIANALEYIWSLPEGASITNGLNTNVITVSFSSTAISGDITVAGYNGCEKGIESAVFPVVVNLGTGIETPGMDTPDMTIYPNPFGSEATISYFLSSPGRVSVEVLNMLGERVILLADEQKPEGKYCLSLKAGNLRPGIYLARMIVKTQEEQTVKTIKIINHAGF